ncbi:MAG: hypothetical protein LBB47_01120 [Spirochaetaceae bacterium]|nr:hypothetical protein [Spirochaetaceae bacterium]
MKVLFPLAAALLVSCAGFGQRENSGGDAPHENYGEKSEEMAEEHYHKDETVLKELPYGIRAYLLKLSAAFAARDAAFLLAQGEGAYEASARSYVSDDQYLAMLYRAGRYADDADWQSPYELNMDKVSHIDYMTWREQGPVLNIDGKIYMNSGRPVACNIKVLWRLDQPKILGAYP